MQTTTAFGHRIDIHVHLADDLDEPHADVLGKAIRLARHYGITRLVLLGNSAALRQSRDPSPDLIRRTNDYTMAVMCHHPDTFVGFCYLNPASPVDFIEREIERCVGRGGMRGIKLWTAVKAVDSRLDPILAGAQRHGVAILHHAWYKQTGYEYNESTPADIANLARRFPRVPIVMAHLAGGGVRGVLDVVDVPNVLIDTSGGQPEADLVEYAVRRLGAHRIVFGSDYPGRDFGAQLGRILGARISEEDKELIVSGNAARVLGLTGSGP